MANWVNEELYTYDMYGNQTGVEVYEINEEVTSSEKAGDVRYSYDESNQMVQYETKGVEETEWTQAARNVYNGEGMRIRQYENGNDWARQYFYIGGALAISTDGSNENFVKSENILDPSGTILAARREAKDGEQIEGSAYWIYHYDAQGSATNLVGVKDGALYRAEENVYDAFGNEETGMKETVSSVQNDIKFTGATLDNSGTYYLGSRHYDPNTGRFLQQDTFKGDVYSPWTQNLYTYTSNNPVNYIDPTGHSMMGALDSAAEKIKKKARQEIDTLHTHKIVNSSVTESSTVSSVRYRQQKELIKQSEAIGYRYEMASITIVLDDGSVVTSGPFRGRAGMVDIQDVYSKLTEMGYDPYDPSTPHYEYYFDHTHDTSDFNSQYNKQSPVNLGLLDKHTRTGGTIDLWASAKDARIIGNQRFGSAPNEGDLKGYSALLKINRAETGKKDWLIEDFAMPYVEEETSIKRRWFFD